MITLAGITINDNMYLSGLENSPAVAYSQKRTIGGTSVVSAVPISGGRQLTLGTQQGKSIQGIWCKSVLDQLKSIESLALPVDLNYRGVSYQVLITGSDVEPFIVREAESPTKSFIGTINLLEV